MSTPQRSRDGVPKGPEVRVRREKGDVKDKGIYGALEGDTVDCRWKKWEDLSLKIEERCEGDRRRKVDGSEWRVYVCEDRGHSG